MGCFASDNRQGTWIKYTGLIADVGKVFGCVPKESYLALSYSQVQLLFVTMLSTIRAKAWAEKIFKETARVHVRDLWEAIHDLQQVAFLATWVSSHEETDELIFH